MQKVKSNMAPRAQSVQSVGRKETILGKKAESYTEMELNRIFQVKKVSVPIKEEKKWDKLVRLKALAREGQIDNAERLKISKKQTDAHHIRYQFMDSEGNYENTAFPRGLPSMSFRGRFMRCDRCKHQGTELNFPKLIGPCCISSSRWCRSCVEDDIIGKIVAGAAHAIQCPFCPDEILSPESIMMNSTNETYQRYTCL